MNVLLMSAGIRNYLVDYFKEALGGRGAVFAADCDPASPALKMADRAFQVPRVDHPDYIESVLAICRDNQVGLILSLNDLELPVLCHYREQLEALGTKSAIVSPEVVKYCFDKAETIAFLKDCGLLVPRTYLTLADARAALAAGELSFPLVIKPRWGTASIGLEFPEDEEEFELAYQLVRRRLTRSILAATSATDPDKCILFQEKLKGQEYGLDVVNDLDGNHVATFAKQKINMRAGETERALTVRDSGLEQLGAVIGRRLRHVANLDCDVFVNDQGFYVLEMNPRFGGGYPFSHLAGANLPAALVAWAEGRPADPAWFEIRAGIAGAKFPSLIITSGDPAADRPADPPSAVAS